MLFHSDGIECPSLGKLKNFSLFSQKISYQILAKFVLFKKIIVCFRGSHERKKKRTLIISVAWKKLASLHNCRFSGSFVFQTLAEFQSSEEIFRNLDFWKMCL